MRLLFLFSLLFASLQAAPFATFFRYSAEQLGPAKQLNSEWIISKDEMRKWDAAAADALYQKQINFYDGIRLFAYLYVAQSDFAYLSYNLTGEFRGSLDPISKKVVSYLLTGYQEPKIVNEDPYSEALAQVVFTKILERLEKENRNSAEFTVPKDLQRVFSAGVQVAKWDPWFAKPSIDYWPEKPPVPNSPIWREQIELIKQEQEPLTEEKKRAVYHWAGLAYPWSDDWRTIANNYLWCHQIPLLECLQVRSMLIIGLYDCIAAYATCKYHYLAARPKTVDSSVHYVIPVPKHPSYPAGHAAESALAYGILSFFFPENANFWREKAEQCAQSRIWAGIHFPIDNQGGKYCGAKVAEKEIAVFKRVSTNP